MNDETTLVALLNKTINVKNIEINAFKILLFHLVITLGIILYWLMIIRITSFSYNC